VPVREAELGDLAILCELVRELARFERLSAEVVFEEADFGRHLFGPDAVARALVAVTDAGEVVGFALWFRSFSTFLGRPGIWLEDLFVRPEHRGRGHGRELLAALRARTDGRVEWSVLDWNEPAQALYRSLGASPVDGWSTWRWPPPPTS